MNSLSIDLETQQLLRKVGVFHFTDEATETPKEDTVSVRAESEAQLFQAQGPGWAPGTQNGSSPEPTASGNL